MLASLSYRAGRRSCLANPRNFLVTIEASVMLYVRPSLQVL